MYNHKPVFKEYTYQCIYNNLIMVTVITENIKNIYNFIIPRSIGLLRTRILTLSLIFFWFADKFNTVF